MKTQPMPMKPIAAATGGLAVAADARRPSLLHPLGRLLDALDRIRSGGASRPGRSDRPLERWEDEDYIYLEAGFPGAHGRSIDINIHDGVALIRVAR